MWSETWQNLSYEEFKLCILLSSKINSYVNMVAFWKAKHTVSSLGVYWAPLNHHVIWTETQSQYTCQRGSQSWCFSKESVCVVCLLSQGAASQTVLHLLMKVCFNLCLGVLPCKIHYSGFHASLISSWKTACQMSTTGETQKPLLHSLTLLRPERWLLQKTWIKSRAECRIH